MEAQSRVDQVLLAAQSALSTLSGVAVAVRPYPPSRTAADSSADPATHAATDAAVEPPPLDAGQRSSAAALMRVNHVGEICAQAMYEAQALATPDAELRSAFRSAAAEEVDHLAWTRRRIDELGGRTSLLSPLWYAGAFSIGLVAGRLGDRASLGFMAETERQVEQHLAGHLERLPAADSASRAIVRQMKDDEVRHGQTATALGGARLPWPVTQAMRLAARVMTTTAHYI
jgi:ubiquinone biosynthesis monooxygenase Coq7